MDFHSILIDDISLMPEGEEKTQVMVKLKLGDKLGYGEETGINSQDETLKLVALATIKAVNSLLPRPLDLKIDHVKISSSSNNAPSIKTLICLKKPNKNIFLNGNFPLSDDYKRSAVNVVLQALQKPIETELNAKIFRQKINTDSQDLTDLFVNLAQTDPSVNVSEFQSESSANSSNSNSTDTPLDTTRAKNIANQARTAYIKGNYEQAAFYYKQAIHFNPFDSFYYHQLGLVLENLTNQTKETEKAFLKAIELSPKEVSYYTDLGFLYKKVGLSEKALNQFKQVLTIDSNNELAKQIVQELSKEQLELSLAPITKSVNPLSKNKASEEPKGLLSLKVSPKVLVISLIAALGFVTLSLAALYTINLPYFNHKATTRPKNKEQIKALELVQNYPSITTGLSLKEHISKIIEKTAPFEWSVGQEKNKKNNREYLVIFSFKKGDKNQYAIWSVDAKEWKVKCRNTIAESFTKP